MAWCQGYLPWTVLSDVAKRDFIYAASRYPVRKLHWRVLRPDDGGSAGGGNGGLFEESANGMRMGQRVLHGKYGEGVVLQFEGNGERAKVQVNFAEGAKWLMVGYANLQVMD